MYTIWFTFIVAVQFACVVCRADGQNMSNLTVEVDHRIFDGDDTEIERFPYQVLLTITYQNPTDHQQLGIRCGGGIINPKVIITAGHCVHNRNPREIKVRAGSSFPDKEGVERDVEKIIVHESYVQETTTSGIGLRKIDYDLALLKLSKGLKYSNSIINIQFANQGDNLAVGDLGKVAGWGYAYGTIPAIVLKETELPVMSNTRCIGATSFTLNDRLFCAGFHTMDTSNICKGDSGGPFVKNNKIYGIVVAAKTDCKGSPSITYVTNTSSVHDWITANVEALSH